MPRALAATPFLKSFILFVFSVVKPTVFMRNVCLEKVKGSVLKATTLKLVVFIIMCHKQ